MIPGMTKRPMTRVRSGFAQATLFGGPKPVPEPVEVASPRYLDPSPRGLTIGRETLETYLDRTGQGAVFTIREVVRGLDYSQFRQSKSGGARGGRPGFHPAIHLGLILFSVMRGVSSLRGIERIAKSDVCSWWLSGGLAPDHSSIGRFIQENQGLLSGPVFEDLTRAILKTTGASGTDLSGDGTTIESAATRYKKICAESAAAKAKELKSQVDKASPKEQPQLKAKIERLERAVEVAEERTARRQKDRGAKTLVDPARVAPSDPDATYQKLKDGTRAYAYKPVVFANERRMIVAQTVESSNENAAIDGLCVQAKEVAAAPIDCLRLDAGFFNSPVLTTLLQHEVDDVLVTEKAVVEQLRGKGQRDRFEKKDFKYDAEDDAYTCPAGHQLTRLRPSAVQSKRARYSGAPCAECPLRAKCTSAKGGRVIQRTPSDETFEAMRETLSYPAARKNYTRRSAMVEPVFADLRQIQGLRRFLRRGLAKARVEFSLHAMAHNLGRLLAVLRAEIALAFGLLWYLWAAVVSRRVAMADHSGIRLRVVV